MNPQPKPVAKPKKPRQPLRRSWMRAGKRKTKHARRVREWGRMAFYKSLPCGLLEAMSALEKVSIHQARVWVDFCDGVVEVAHLGPRAGWRRGKDAETAPLCRKHHRDIDGQVGGKAPWYVARGREGQFAVRARLIAQADALWFALDPEQRAEWDARAELRGPVQGEDR